MLSVSELSSEEAVTIWLVEVLVVVVVDVTESNCTAEGWRDMMASPS